MSQDVGEIPLFKVGIIADVQYCNTENKGTRYYSASADKLNDAVLEFKKMNVDCIINLGDFIDRDYDSFLPLIKIMDQIEIPVFNVLGNHDFSVDEDRKKEIPRLFGLKKRYYTVTMNNWRFVFLDGTNISTYANKPGSNEYKKALN